MEVAAIIVSAIAAITIALFTWRTWLVSNAQHKLSNEQHKLYHDPDLAVFSLSQGLDQFDKVNDYNEDNLITYNALIVNHGRIPIVITDVWEKITDDIDNKDIQGLFHIPPGIETEGKKLLLELPAVVPSGDFLICTRDCKAKVFFEHLSDSSRKQLLNSLIVKIEYYTTMDRPKITKRRILLYTDKIKRAILQRF